MTFAAIIDTGGPITVVSPAFADAVGDEAHDSGARTVLRLAGRRYDAPLFSVTLALHSSWEAPEDLRLWASMVGVLDPWPHEGTALILGQHGFLDRFTVTFGPQGFAVEPGETFSTRFGPSWPAD
ncbi:MAG: hypothetical protein ACRDZ8_01800 [Acidimicrobiales bacterium]